MKRRIVSIICIMFLLFTITSPISGSIFSYASEDTLTDQQKVNLGVSTYFNNRKGWFSSNNVYASVAIILRETSDFYTSPSNNTGINSTSELASHITIGKNNSGNWGVHIDNDGLTFLDHLCKYLLGKNKFPNLYSGGSWGSSGNTLDPIYNGLINGDSLFYDIKSDSYYETRFTVNTNQISLGSPARGLTHEIIYDAFTRANPNFDIFLAGNQDNYSYTLNVQYSANITRTYSLQSVMTYANNPDPYAPNIKVSGSYNINGYGFIYSRRSYTTTGNPAFMRLYDNNNNFMGFATGIVTYDYHANNYKIYKDYTIGSTQPAGTTSANVNFNTDDFDKSDQAENNPDGVTYTPQYTTNEGDTYNYYNENDNSTVNNFYNNYITNYTYNTNNEYNSTIINNNSGEGSDNPGGTTPPWDNSSGAGTLTPDGNGGYNFNLPDLTLPDLNIDWNLRGLSEKFPFSIPWDLLAFFTVLNAEPETPAIEAQIDLGIVDWDIDWDLHNFDTLAALLRNLEFIGFCLALILITRSIIKG